MTDKCAYCDDEGRYLDFHEDRFVSVCKKHLFMEISG
jgi:hypothetical protein